MKIEGYHGTDSDSADTILATQFNVSCNDEWFGRGVYFFETIHPVCDGFDEAKNWCKYVKRYASWSVLKSEIESDTYLDFTNNISHKKIFDNFQKIAMKRHLASGEKEEDFEERLIYILIEEKSKIDFIKAYTDGSSYKGYEKHTVRRLQVQVCVKNIKSIKRTTLKTSGERGKNG